MKAAVGNYAYPMTQSYFSELQHSRSVFVFQSVYMYALFSKLELSEKRTAMD